MNGHFYFNEIAASSYRQHLIDQASTARRVRHAGDQSERSGRVGFFARWRSARATAMPTAPVTVLAVLAPASLDEAPAAA